MKRFLIFLLLILALPSAAAAQDVEYRLDFNREFGYGAGSSVRGRMSLALVGDLENVASVTYYMDGSEMTTLTEPPFKLAFSTSEFPVGQREMTALVRTKDGREITTQPVRRNFISSDEESQSMQRILIPLLGGVLLFTLIGVGTQVLASRKDGGHLPPGTPRSYGLKGGTICPRCARPYSLHFYGINLALGMYDRCDHCGKWAFVRRRSPAELALAEQAELQAYQASERSLPGAEDAELTEEERLRKLLDESKYTK